MNWVVAIILLLFFLTPLFTGFDRRRDGYLERERERRRRKR